MKQRVISAIVALPLLFAILFSGNEYIIGGSLLILSIIGLFELYKSFDKTDLKLEKPYKFMGYIAAIVFYIFKLMKINIGFNIFLMIFSFIVIAYSMLTYNNKSIGKMAITILSTIYIPFLFSYILNIYTSEQIMSPYIVGYVFVVAFGSDTVACLIGKYFGTKKITPVLSPNKSLEGFIGGILGSVALTLIYTYILKLGSIINASIDNRDLMMLVIFAIAGAMISQIGDLLASAIKRTNRIKDYGNLMPGHGGVLDRFDSILFVAPLVFYFFTIFKF